MVKTAQRVEPRGKAFPLIIFIQKIMILGGGPNRIGQGIEFDYCCCHGRKSLRALLIEFSSENSRNFIPSKNLIP